MTAQKRGNKPNYTQTNARAHRCPIKHLQISCVHCYPYPGQHESCLVTVKAKPRQLIDDYGEFGRHSICDEKFVMPRSEFNLSWLSSVQVRSSCWPRSCNVEQFSFRIAFVIRSRHSQVRVVSVKLKTCSIGEKAKFFQVWYIRPAVIQNTDLLAPCSDWYLSKDPCILLCQVPELM